MSELTTKTDDIGILATELRGRYHAIALMLADGGDVWSFDLHSETTYLFTEKGLLEWRPHEMLRPTPRLHALVAYLRSGKHLFDSHREELRAFIDSDRRLDPVRDELREILSRDASAMEIALLDARAGGAIYRTLKTKSDIVPLKSLSPTERRICEAMTPGEWLYATDIFRLAGLGEESTPYRTKSAMVGRHANALTKRGLLEKRHRGDPQWRRAA